MKLYFLVGFLALFTNFSFAQAVFIPSEKQQTVEAYPLNKSLKIDGHLDESEWNLAKPVHLNFQVEPFQGNKASFETQVKILSSPQFLYVGVINKDTIGKNKYRAPNLKRDFMFGEQDLFGIAFDAFNDKRNAIVMQSNAYGAQRDLLSFDDLQFDVDWDGLYRVRTHRADTAWIAEFAIPWSTLRYPRVKNNETQNWGINFFRNRRTSNELNVWSPVPRAFSPLRMDYAGQLVNITPPEPSITNIRAIPYILFADVNNNGSEVGYKNASEFKMGGEVKWAINNNNILDLTFNTDFAQADVDRQVNNISRFSVFFPERRQFFLENASLFSAGLAPIDEVMGGSMNIRPFFSRTIGLDKDVNPVPIIAGGRYVYRSDKNNFGAILMRQGAADGAEFTDFGVARLSHNFGKQNRFGGIITSKLNNLITENTYAADAFVRLSAKMYYAGMVSLTSNTTNSNTGIAQYNQIMYRTNSLGFYWTQTYINDKYTPAMGFVSRNNVLSNSQGAYYQMRKSWYPKWLRSLEPGIYTEVYHSASNMHLLERSITVTPAWITLQNGGMIGFFTVFQYQNIESDFKPLEVQIAKGQYDYIRNGLMISSDQSKKFSYMLNADIGNYYNGSTRLYLVKTNFAPIPHVNFGLTLNRSEIKDLGILRESKNINLWMIESRLAINPRLQLIGFYQQNALNDLKSLNLRVSWEYKPLSYIYLVLNQVEHMGDDLTIQKQKAFLAKVSYLKQF